MPPRATNADRPLKGQPLAEVFGFAHDNTSAEAEHFRAEKLCPFNNGKPKCTKGSVTNPIGVCSVIHQSQPVITCPVRFREKWKIISDAREFFFPDSTTWNVVSEVQLDDAAGQSAGKIDFVIVSLDKYGSIVDYGALEVQAVYISGSVSGPFRRYQDSRDTYLVHDWSKQEEYPRPDFLSSSRKRLAPQLLFKGRILQTWKRRIAVATDLRFFETLPPLASVPREQADLAWFVYDLKREGTGQNYRLQREHILYAKFDEALEEITVPKVGDQKDFLVTLQKKLKDSTITIEGDVAEGDDIANGDNPT